MNINTEQQKALRRLSAMLKSLSSMQYSLISIADYIVKREYAPSEELLGYLHDIDIEIEDMKMTLNYRETLVERNSRAQYGLPV